MDPETRRLQIHRRDLRNGSIYDCLFSVAMIVSIATTLGLSASSNCEQLPARFSFCIPCENRLVIWGIVAAPVYAALFVVRFKMFLQLKSEALEQVQLLLQSAMYRFWRVVHMVNGAWTMLGAIWYLNRSECNEAPNYQRLMNFVSILFWISISKYLLIALIWMILFCMVRVCPNHPLVMRLFGTMAQPFTDGARPVVPGVTAEQLSMFPVFTLPQPEGSPDCIAVEDRECAICLCPYEDEQPIKRLFCRHHYHSACIDQWLSTKSTCPLCNSNVLSHLNPPSAPVSASASPQFVAAGSFGGTGSPGGPFAAGEGVVEFRIQLQPAAASTDASSLELSEFFDGATLEQQQRAYNSYAQHAVSGARSADSEP